MLLVVWRRGVRVTVRIGSMVMGFAKVVVVRRRAGRRAGRVKCMVVRVIAGGSFGVCGVVWR